MVVKGGARKRNRVYFGETKNLIEIKVVEQPVLYLKDRTFREL